MSRRKNLTERWEELGFDIPLSDEEVDEIIAESGIDVEASLAKLMRQIESKEESE